MGYRAVKLKETLDCDEVFGVIVDENVTFVMLF